MDDVKIGQIYYNGITYGKVIDVFKKDIGVDVVVFRYGHTSDCNTMVTYTSLSEFKKLYQELIHVHTVTLPQTPITVRRGKAVAVACYRADEDILVFSNDSSLHKSTLKDQGYEWFDPKSETWRKF